MMSYFHEYYQAENGKKTLRGYTHPINLMRFGTKWIIREDDLWDIAEKIYDTPILSVVPAKNKQYIRPAHPFECLATNVEEWSAPES